MMVFCDHAEAHTPPKKTKRRRKDKRKKKKDNNYAQTDNIPNPYPAPHDDEQ